MIFLVVGKFINQKRSVGTFRTFGGCTLDNKIVYAVIVGVALSAVVMALRSMGMEGPQTILFFATFFLVGLVATGAKRGFLLSFVLSLAASFAMNVDGALQVFSDINIVMAILMFSAVSAAICGALGAVGGLIGKRVFNKQ